MENENLFAVNNKCEIIALNTQDHTEARHKIINALDLSENWQIIKGCERYILVDYGHMVTVEDILAPKLTKRIWFSGYKADGAEKKAKQVLREYNAICTNAVGVVYNKRTEAKS